ncbi:MAG TPA: NB-ARC domain-containing protein [Candidatus Baltobacteraceae bacterium]|nr:NB-ARC domain-containing protein [Candidatus Baltobacteraceae bacterium]
MHQRQREASLVGNLPRYPTPIVGRQREIVAVDRALSASRVVTIVGAGGIGKTRLAVEVATNVVARSRGGIYFIDLEPLVDADFVAPTIAAALGAELRGGADPVAFIVNLLQSQTLLLVLDNCEQVIRQVALLTATLVERCPQVRVLATSREPLRVGSEFVYRLDTLDDASGVELFVERAQKVNDAFVLTGSDAPVVAQICRKLDGIPLAIELAAARVGSETPKALLARLNERFRWQADAKVTRRHHHRTLQALIGWSYDLLGEHERSVFARLGVFGGEFSLAAVRHVVDEDARLRELSEKSLIVASTHAQDRFRMLESVREYAIMRLGERGGENEVKHKHAAFFTELSGHVASDFGNCSEAEWRARYEPDLENFRAALSWAQVHDKGLASTMLGNLKEFWFHENLISEGLSRSQVVLASLPVDDDRALGALLAVATLAWRAGENRTGLDAATRALEIATRKGDARAIATARYGIGWALFKSGEPERGLAALRDALEAYRVLDDPLRTLLTEIDYAIALKRSDPQRGRALLKSALPTARTSGWPRPVVRIESGLAEYAFLDGSVGIAIELAREALATARAGKSAYALAVALVNLTSYLSVAGDAEEARAVGIEAVNLGRSYGMRIVVEWALQALALGLAERGELRAAAQVLGHVDAFVEEVDAEREPTEEVVRKHLDDLLRRELEPVVLEAEMAAGRALTADAACARAEVP